MPQREEFVVTIPAIVTPALAKGREKKIGITTGNFSAMVAATKGKQRTRSIEP
jgi:hypothetical protein